MPDIKSQIIADLSFVGLSLFQGNHFNAIRRDIPLGEFPVKSPQIFRILKKLIKTDVKKIDLAKQFDILSFFFGLRFAFPKNFLNIIRCLFKQLFVKHFHDFSCVTADGAYYKKSGNTENG